MTDKNEEEILEWYKTASNMEKLIFYRSAHGLADKFEQLEAQVSKYKKFHGMYGFEKMEVARHVQLYKDYQEKFKRYHFKMEDKIESLEAKLHYQLEINDGLNKKIARYTRDVADEDVFRGGMIP